MHRSAFRHLLVGLLVAGFLAPPLAPLWPAAAVGERFTTVAEAVAAGIVDPAVADALAAGGAAEGLVSVSSQVVDEAATLPPGPDRAAAVRGRIRPALAELKGRAVQRLGGGGEVIRDFGNLPTAFVRFRSLEALLAVANAPEVTSIAPNLVVFSATAESGRLVRATEAVAAGYAGAGTSVAVLDTGLDYTRAAFGSCSAPGAPASCRVTASRDIAAEDGVLDSGSFHGTNVAGIVAGIAPGTRIIGLDVFRADGTSSSAEIAAAIDWVVDNQAAYNIRAMNLSLGSGAYSSTCPADPGFGSARAVGVIPVVAAGNSGNANGIGWPACLPSVVAVGAVYDANVGSRSYAVCSDAVTVADKVTCFSQSSSALDILAPGAIVTAAQISMVGTSQATPHVAAAAAVVAAAAPDRALDQLQAALTGSGPSITDPRNGLVRRRLDVYAAVVSLVGGTASADTTAPTVTAVEPVNGAMAAAASVSPAAVFSEAVSGVSASTFTLRALATGASIPATVSYDAAARRAVLDPSADLGPGTSYTASLSDGIRDAAGNPLAATSWMFTTAAGDTTPPTVTAFEPANGAGGVSTAVSPAAVFSEPVSGVSTATFTLRVRSTGAAVSAAVRYDAAARRAVIDPGVNLGFGTTYTVSLSSAIRDAAGNQLTAAAWTFTTAMAPPVIGRAAGADRYATAAAVSRARFAPGVRAVFIATGRNFPDALAGGPVAAALGGPLLLVTESRIPQPTADELARLRPQRIFVLGSSGVVSDAVVAALRGYASSVSRLAGADRYATAAAASAAVFGAGVASVYIANGRAYSDPTAAAGLSGPLLLVTPTKIPGSTAAELKRLRPGRIVIVGTPASVSDGVAAALRSYGPVTRISGANPYETSVAVSKAHYAAAGSGHVYIATGDNFPDALAAGAAAGSVRGPLLLVAAGSLPPSVRAELLRLAPARITFVGSTGAIAQSVEDEVRAMFGAQ